jgi:RNA polymerase sigma factor (sigma-70 family)
MSGRVLGLTLNKTDVRQTPMSVRQRGATPAQLEALYRERFEYFARVASAICSDLDLGRDAVQAAFMTAVRERRSYRGTGTLESWVWRIVVNEARRLAREPHAARLEAADEPSGNGEGDDVLGLRAWIAALPGRQREALFLRYYADLEYRTIAEVLGVEIGTVSATLSAAHQTLRKRLEEVRR